MLTFVGIIAARDGTLTFMVGGKSENFPTAQDLLQHMGKNVVHCGAIGTGQVGNNSCSRTFYVHAIYHIGPPSLSRGFVQAVISTIGLFRNTRNCLSLNRTFSLGALNPKLPAQHPNVLTTGPCSHASCLR